LPTALYAQCLSINARRSKERPSLALASEGLIILAYLHYVGIMGTLLLTLAQIYLRTENPTNGEINARITNPLAQHVGSFVSFTYAVLAILGIITAYRIYTLWQAGEEDNIIQSISRWILGMVLCLALIAGLKLWMATNPA